MAAKEAININISKDLTYQYLLSLGRHEDEIGLILKGHLLLEFVLNEIIKKRFKDTGEILRDYRAYTFSVKLQMLYSAGYLPNLLFQNIRRINRLRNHLAHHLKFDLDQSKFKFNGSDGKEISIKTKDLRTRYPIRHYCKTLCFGTLAQFRNHFLLEFGEFPSDPFLEI